MHLFIYSFLSRAARTYLHQHLPAGHTLTFGTAVPAFQ